MAISRRKFLGLSLATTAFVGCEKLRPMEKDPDNPFQLNKIRVASSAIKMEFAVFKVLRYRQHLLKDAWDKLDQQIVGLDQRRVLDANGIRVGLTGAQLPPQLQLLLQPPAIDRSKLTGAQKELIDAGLGKAEELKEQHVKVSLRPNKVKDLAFGPPMESLGWDWINGKAITKKRFSNVQTKIRVVAQPAPGRSIRLGVIPFLTYGGQRTRYEVKENDFQLVMEKNQHLISEANVKIPMSLGQTIVLGPSVENIEKTRSRFGDSFFGVNGQIDQGNRIVFLRLIHAGEADLFGDRFRKQSIVNEV